MSTIPDQFNEADLSSYYFPSLKREDVVAILEEQMEGTFLVRDSSRGGYVVCVKESSKTVNEYLVSTDPNTGKLFIRPEFHFKDLPALLSFYKRNTFTTTGLVRPVSKEKVTEHLKITKGEDNNDQDKIRDNRNTMPVPGLLQFGEPGERRHRRSAPASGTDTHPPVYAKVIKPRVPSVYTSQELALQVGDIIRITKRGANGQGHGEVLGNGKRGTFPLTHVEILKELNDATLIGENCNKPDS